MVVMVLVVSGFPCGEGRVCGWHRRRRCCYFVVVVVVAVVVIVVVVIIVDIEEELGKVDAVGTELMYVWFKP